jgi:Tfp pilus assembly protein PilX
MILMIAVTLLGISSMKTTMVEHKIVSNTRNQTLALSSAEAALNEATEIIQGQSGDEKRSGFKLKDLQDNGLTFDSSNLNQPASRISISINGTQSISVPLWGDGAVTDNASYLGSASEQSWWENNANTATLSTDLSAANTQLEENNYHLDSNPRYLIEKGEFIPDDLSPNTLAAYRGRQAFTAISRSTGSTGSAETRLQANVVTRFR